MMLRFIFFPIIFSLSISKDARTLTSNENCHFNKRVIIDSHSGLSFASGAMLAAVMNRVLVLRWDLDQALGVKFEDLFVSPQTPSHLVPLLLYHTNLNGSSYGLRDRVVSVCNIEIDQQNNFEGIALFFDSQVIFFFIRLQPFLLTLIYLCLHPNVRLIVVYKGSKQLSCREDIKQSIFWSSSSQ